MTPTRSGGLAPELFFRPGTAFGRVSKGVPRARIFLERALGHRASSGNQAPEVSAGKAILVVANGSDGSLHRLNASLSLSGSHGLQPRELVLDTLGGAKGRELLKARKSLAPAP